MSQVEKLRESLRKFQEPKGYFFNPDRELVLELLEGLLTNKDRYGYMSCPCRLAQNDRDKDKDIICPCVYREPDVAEFGACYCALYVSKEVAEGAPLPELVPERRPPERMPF
jgi:ferredoxin-thioredoxin reductase catalytic subunit